MPIQLPSSDTETFVVTDADIGLVVGDPGVTYTLRSITKADIDRLQAKHQRREFNKMSRRFEDVFDQKAYDTALFDLALVDWTGVTRGSDPAPCTLENKLLLDPLRQKLIVTHATMNRIVSTATEEDAEADSFRAPESVR